MINTAIRILIADIQIGGKNSFLSVHKISVILSLKDIVILVATEIID